MHAATIRQRCLRVTPHRTCALVYGKQCQQPYCRLSTSHCTSMAYGQQTACETLLATQVLKQHQRAISDLDWSLDNTFLLSAGLEGSVTMWMAATGQLLRIFLTTSPACCAKFHLVNQNLIIAGTESGVLQVFNCSTGMHVILRTHGCQYHRQICMPQFLLCLVLPRPIYITTSTSASPCNHVATGQC